MFITVEDLEKYKACDNGKRFVRRFHPNGFEMSQLVLDKHIPKEFVHWARENLPCEELEKQLYLQRMDIQDSAYFSYSHNLKNSEYVKRSHDVKNSKHVIKSDNVSNSQDIIMSSWVEDGEYIYSSEFVNKSSHVFEGKNISQSNNIVGSNTVINSKSVIDSNDIIDCSEIANCEELTSCFFCVDCKKLKNCMFCYGLTEAEYFIFNKPVSKEKFEVFVKQYKKVLDGYEMKLCKFWPPPELLSIVLPQKVAHRFFYHRKIKKDFVRWIKTMPNYDQEVLYNLILLPEFLVD